MSQSARLAKSTRRIRAISAPTFGARLRTLRGTRSRGAMCDELLALGLTLNRSTLLQYERGTVTSPDPAVLWGLSRLYHVSVDDLVLDLVRDRTHRPVPARASDAATLTHAQRRAADFIAQVDPETADQFLQFLGYLANPSKAETPASPRPRPVLAPSKPRPQKG